MKINLYPLKLTPVSKSAIWGGNSLASEWGKKICGENIAESWELTVRQKEMSVIENGEAAGMPLKNYFEAVGNAAVSPGYDGENFPILIKFIDAAAPLSVQVHPDDEASARLEGDVGKTEMWYIVDAKPNAKLVYGLADGVSREEFVNAVLSGETERVLKFQPVRRGESYFIPAGLLHAIGEGILIAEIQQNSDITYRAYDYGRLQADGKPRELHVEKALEVTKSFTDAEIQAARYKNGKNNDTNVLADSEYFRVRKITIEKKKTAELSTGKNSFASLLCLTGEGEITFADKVYPIKKGDSYFIPAGMGEYKITAKCAVELLETKIN